MRRPAHPIVNALTVAACLSGSLALATVPTPDEANTPMTSVSKREPFAFASTPDGLFRAPLATKRWEKLGMPAHMPKGGTFAMQTGRSPLVIYSASRSRHDHRPRGTLRFGLYLSRDDGSTWELVSEREDFGPILLHPSGELFAVTGADGINFGNRLGRSTDLGETWRDITGAASGGFSSLEPDPDHPGLVRVHGGVLRAITYVAEDDNYRWEGIPGRRTGDEFFSRSYSTTDRLYKYPATLSNYFRYDFGSWSDAAALEVVPLNSRFEFASGARVVVPIRVVFHYDADAELVRWRKSTANGRPYEKPTPPVVKFAVQPDGIDFWGLRVESSGGRIEKAASGSRINRITSTTTPDGKAVTTTYRTPDVRYSVVRLSPSSPYEQEVDLGRLSDFSRPGEYRVQLVYNSGGQPDRKKDEWDGCFMGPVFTVVIRD